MKICRYIGLFWLFGILVSLGYSVDISTCQDISSPGVYYLTTDISNQDGNCFVINASNVTLDCQGHTISGDGDIYGYGIFVNAFDYGTLYNITIFNCSLNKFLHGIYFRGGNTYVVRDSKIIDINSSYNQYGIHLYSSNKVNLTNITVKNNYNDGIYLSSSNSNIIRNLISQENHKYDFHLIAGSVYNCLNPIINATGSGNRPIGYYNYSVNLENLTFSELILCNASYSNLTNLTIKGSDAYKNNGLYIFYTDNSNINKINSSYTYRGIYLQNSNNNEITNSFFTLNNISGIYLYNSGGNGPNLIYNNFFNNTNNTYFYATSYTNFWNTTLTSETNIKGGNYIGGNFWATPTGTGFSEKCNDTNYDGICDDPYIIDENNTDYMALSNMNYKISGCLDISNPGYYALQNDISNQDGNCFVINASNITLDCHGNTIDGDGDSTGYGIYVNAYYAGNLEYINIFNCTIKEFDIGLSTYGFINIINHSKIYDITVLNSSRSYSILNIQYTIISNLSSSNTTYGLRLISTYTNITNIYVENTIYSGLQLDHSQQCILTNITLINNSEGIYSYWSSNINLSKINLDNSTTYGIYLDNSRDINIIDGFISNSDKYGIYSYLSQTNFENILINNSKYYDYYTSTSSISCRDRLINVTGSGNRPIGYYNYSVNLENLTFSELILCNASYSNLTNLTIKGSDTYKNNGLLVYYTNHSNFKNISSNHNQQGISLINSSSNLLYDSIFQGNIYGIYLLNSGMYGSNNIFNNYFNNTNNTYYSGITYTNFWNTTLTSGTNIYGGQYIGGNYWATPTGNGYSETCTDEDGNGICDNPYTLTTNNTDYLPLTRQTKWNCSSCSECSNIILNTQPNDVVYLISDIINQNGNCIEFNGIDNITFDCLGHTINGDSDTNGYGIYISSSNGGSNYITITNCTNISDFYYGIYHDGSSHNTIQNSNILNNIYDGLLLAYSDYNNIINLSLFNNSRYGLFFAYSKYNNIQNSKISENGRLDVFISSGSIDEYCNNNLSNIMSSGDRPIGYYNYSVNLENLTFSELVLCNADYSNLTNITIKGSNIKKNNVLFIHKTENSNIDYINSSNNFYGIDLYYSSFNKISNAILSNNNYPGLLIEHSSNNKFEYIHSYDNRFYGIDLLFSNNNIIKNTIIRNNTHTGIYNYYSSNNSFIQTKFNNNFYYGTLFVQSNYTKMSYCDLFNNSETGIYIFYSYSNSLNNNNIYNNKYHGIALDGISFNNSIRNNNISLNYYSGIYFHNDTDNIPYDNYIYNNFLNNTNNTYFNNTNYISFENYWNTTLTHEINIYGGENIGGNFWATPAGNGYSETCTDEDGNGICDTPYTLTTNNIDYLPLSIYVARVYPTLEIIYKSNSPGYNNQDYVLKDESSSRVVLLTRNLNYISKNANTNEIRIKDKISNKFMFAFTKANKYQIDDRIDLIKKGKFFNRALVSFYNALSENYEFIAEIIKNIDIINNLVVKEGYSRIRLERTNYKGTPKISVELI